MNSEVVAPLPAASYRDPATSRAKRAIDLALASIGLVIALPLLLVVAALIIVETGWSPLFVQKRAGIDGRPFYMLKFRTMIKGAHSMREGLLVQNEAAFPAFKIRRDPRVTKFGGLLRRSSLDELPQLINVLLGDMSLVGPRPLPVEESALLRPHERERLRTRPGLTGIWQIENRHNQCSFDEWLAMDLRYIRNWSIGLDFRLMLRTVSAVLRMTGY